MPSARCNHATTKSAGFTLVELVIVIIVLGVLAATAIPKLASKSGFEDYTVRDQLIARLRLVQLQGMNADPTAGATENGCYYLVVKARCFYHEQAARVGASCALPSAAGVCDLDDYNQYNAINYSDGMLTPSNYRFDLQGKLIAGANSITIFGENNLSVSIESEGYIHE